MALVDGQSRVQTPDIGVSGCFLCGYGHASLQPLAVPSPPVKMYTSKLGLERFRRTAHERGGTHGHVCQFSQQSRSVSPPRSGASSISPRLCAAGSEQPARGGRLHCTKYTCMHACLMAND
ncbi:serine threonine protein [Lasius niger]|uniref:Serine threonine protein n=1 Tax=Lasius niger TaxID=67767 RepID=A0A0J7MMD5_LASNI|nr:serine threonine protein [Lasius niger]